MQELQTVRMNVIAKRISPEKFYKIYSKLVAKYNEETARAMFMFSDTSVLDKAIATARKALPGELRSEFDKKKKEINTNDDLATVVSELFNRCGTQLVRLPCFLSATESIFMSAPTGRYRGKAIRLVDRYELENRLPEIFRGGVGCRI
jgi:hypothetical protein